MDYVVHLLGGIIAAYCDQQERNYSSFASGLNDTCLISFILLIRGGLHR